MDKTESKRTASVIGCGRWGSFLAWYLDYLGYSVRLYGRASSKKYEELETTGKNEFLSLRPHTRLTAELGTAAESEFLFLAVGAQNLRPLMRELCAFDLRGKVLVLCMKGMEADSGKRLSEVVSEFGLGPEQVAIWVGPGHVQDFVKGMPNSMLLDSQNRELALRLASLLKSELIQFDIGGDLIGNELGAAAKNVYGIVAGMLDSIGYSSLKGALLVRAAAELAGLVEAAGGKRESVYGLSFLGEAETTFFSERSVNRRYGMEFVEVKETLSLCEGTYTLDALLLLAREKQVALPICEALAVVLARHVPMNEALSALFGCLVRQA